MSFTVSTNMGLIIPGVGTEAGPTYAQDVNDSLTRIDSHDHTAGNGVPITPDGLNINKALPLNNNSLTTIAALTLTPQGVDAAINSIYEKGVDLYYRDGNGNVIRITQSGSVSGASGTITGLPSGTASASFGASVFTFQAATLTPADIDGGSFVFRNNVASSFGLTLSPPAAMSANFDLVLPTLPSSKKILTLDTSGNIIADEPIPEFEVDLTGSASSASVGTYVTAGSVVIATTGTAPVLIQLIQAPTPFQSFVGLSGPTTTLSGIVRILRNFSDIVGEAPLSGTQPALNVPVGGFVFLDQSPIAGSVTYSVQVAPFSASTTISISPTTLLAREI